jgi:hypothetical protein
VRKDYDCPSKSDWVKHTRNSCRGKHGTNRANRRAVKEAVRICTQTKRTPMPNASSGRMVA